MTHQNLESRAAYKIPGIMGGEIYEISEDRYVVFASFAGRIVWSEFYQGIELRQTGRHGEEIGIENKDWYKELILEQLEEHPPFQVRSHCV